MTSNVLPYEKMKLRLLNASHQAICYIGMLLGYQFSDEAMANPNIRILMQRMMDEEVTQLLDRVEGVDLEAYKAGLVERFSNSAIRDQLARIGTEGSARIPKFIWPSILDQLQRNGPVRLLSFTVACWFRYLAGHDDQGRPLPLVDPMAEKLREHALNGRGNPGPLLGIRELFGDVLPAAPGFVSEVGRALADLYEYGAALALERVLTPRD
jgi:mannitol 2-dehydrogenase